MEPGDAAPGFTLSDTSGNTVTLASLRGKQVVLFFYPKDDTPGCTIEAKEFSSLLSEFKEKNVAVYGVSRDDAKSHEQFSKKCDLTVPLLTADRTVLGEFGVWKEKNLYGKNVTGISRTTFLIGPEGRIARVWESVRPEGHAKEVLEATS